MSLPAKLLGYVRWRMGWTPEARSRRAVRRLGLGPGCLVLDCGANVGDFTELLASTGAEVHAYEPNPHAYEVLIRRCAKFCNVFCHQAAVGPRAGRMPLYLHELSPRDEVLYSNGSSLLAEKPNVSRERSVEVEVVDLAEVILALPRGVDVLKMDIEGAEVAVLERLLESGALDRVRRAFIETHEKKIPSLAEGTAKLKQALSGHPRCVFQWDWV